MKSRIITGLLFFIFVIAANGCAVEPTVKTSSYRESYPATDPESVKIFQKKPADREFEEVAEIIVDMATGWKQVERIFRSKGAEFGADAVYVLKEKEYTRGVYQPHDCHYYLEHGYPPYFYDPYYYGPGHFRDYYFRFGYPRRFYYCYGGRYATEKSGYMKVIGIAIRWVSDQKKE